MLRRTVNPVSQAARARRMVSSSDDSEAGSEHASEQEGADEEWEYESEFS